MANTGPKDSTNASQLITKRIAEFDDWRGKTLGRLRKLIHEAVPEIKEEWKWDSPVFSLNGLVCSVGAFKEHVKLNFFKGASLKDPKGLFNAGLDAKVTRSIDFHEGDKLDAAGLKDLIQAAAEISS